MLPLTELGHGRQGQINEMGGVNWVSNPCVRVKSCLVYHLNAECSCPPRGTYTNNRGVALYPSEQPDYKQQCTRSCTLKKGGYTWNICRPLRNTPISTITADSCYTITADSWYMYFELIVTVVDTRKFQ